MALRPLARGRWVTRTVVWALFHRRQASPGPTHLVPGSHWGSFLFFCLFFLGELFFSLEGAGVLLHSTDPQDSSLGDPQPETAHCHKHNESI